MDCHDHKACESLNGFVGFKLALNVIDHVLKVKMKIIHQQLE